MSKNIKGRMNFLDERIKHVKFQACPDGAIFVFPHRPVTPARTDGRSAETRWYVIHQHP